MAPSYQCAIDKERAAILHNCILLLRLQILEVKFMQIFGAWSSTDPNLLRGEQLLLIWHTSLQLCAIV